MPHLYNIPVTIADILVDISSPLNSTELGIDARLGPFFGVPSNPLGRVAVRWKESPSSPVAPGQMIYDPGSIWKMYRAGQDFYAAITYHDDGIAAQAQSVLRANSTWDDLTLTERRTGSQWTSLLNLGAGELILRTAILFTGGLIFHACAIDDNGRGIVFAGHAGAGKSTQAGLWTTQPGVVAMNDDRVAVRMNDNRPICYGTPWGGTADIARNHGAPLSAIILIEQAPENEIQLISSATAAPLLLARAFLPYWDQSLMQRAFANLNAILASTPVYRLRCRPEMAVIPLVRSAL